MAASFRLLVLFIAIVSVNCLNRYYLTVEDYHETDIYYSGFEYEGPVGYAYKNPAAAPNLIPFSQLRSPIDANNINVEYFYTSDPAEKQQVLSTGVWMEDGAFYVYGAEAVGTVPLYRLIEDATGDHIWTSDPVNVQQLQAANWRVEGIACWVATEPPQPKEGDPPQTVFPISRFYRPQPLLDPVEFLYPLSPVP